MCFNSLVSIPPPWPRLLAGEEEERMDHNQNYEGWRVDEKGRKQNCKGQVFVWRIYWRQIPVFNDASLLHKSSWMVCLGTAMLPGLWGRKVGTFCPLPVLGPLLYFSRFGWGWLLFNAVCFQAEVWDCGKELLQSKETISEAEPVSSHRHENFFPHHSQS